VGPGCVASSDPSDCETDMDVTREQRHGYRVLRMTRRILREANPEPYRRPIVGVR
jgi:hypothetical protein